MFTHDLIITKRWLGFILIALGIIGGAGILLVDRLGVGKDSALGPLQIAALVFGAFTVLVGISLIPLGDRPA
jgi:hypothetical protein